MFFFYLKHHLQLQVSRLRLPYKLRTEAAKYGNTSQADLRWSFQSLVPSAVNDFLRISIIIYIESPNVHQTFNVNESVTWISFVLMSSRIFSWQAVSTVIHLAIKLLYRRTNLLESKGKPLSLEERTSNDELGVFFVLHIVSAHYLFQRHFALLK